MWNIAEELLPPPLPSTPSQVLWIQGVGSKVIKATRFGFRPSLLTNSFLKTSWEARGCFLPKTTVSLRQKPRCGGGWVRGSGRGFQQLPEAVGSVVCLVSSCAKSRPGRVTCSLLVDNLFEWRLFTLAGHFRWQNLFSQNEVIMEDIARSRLIAATLARITHMLNP